MNLIIIAIYTNFCQTNYLNHHWFKEKPIKLRIDNNLKFKYFVQSNAPDVLHGSAMLVYKEIS